MGLDHSVYPDERVPPEDLATPEARAEYLHRLCAAFDFGIFPEREDWIRLRDWRAVFDAHPLPDSPAYHTFRATFGWPAVSRGTCSLTPPWRRQDNRESRSDPCEDAV